MPLVGLIIGRDFILLTGAFVHRFRAVGWRWPGVAEFFRLSASASPLTSVDISSVPKSQEPTRGTHASKQRNSSSNKDLTARDADQNQQQKHQASVDEHISGIGLIGSLKRKPTDEQQEASQKSGREGVDSNQTQPAAFVQPLYISKVNTCLQLLLVGGCLTNAWYAWPSEAALLALGIATGGTTLASCGAYIRVYLKEGAK